MKYLRLNRRLLPLNALLVAGFLIWGACGSTPATTTTTPPPTTSTPPPTVKLEPYRPPTTTTTWPNGWTTELLRAAYDGFAEGYGEMDELGNCVFAELVLRYSPQEFAEIGPGEAEIREALAPILEECS